LICIAALDDPIIPGILTQRNIDAVGVNPNIIVVQTQRGGHIGWYTKHQTQWWLDVVKEFAGSLETPMG
jgi:predicted alpha/beta-fold hydrolase